MLSDGGRPEEEWQNCPEFGSPLLRSHVSRRGIKDVTGKLKSSRTAPGGAEAAAGSRHGAGARDRHRRAKRTHATRCRRSAPGGARRRLTVLITGEWCRQGGDRPFHPRRVGSCRSPVCGDQLRGCARVADRKRIVRAHEGRSLAPRRTASVSSNRPMAEPCCSTKWATCRCPCR